MTTPTIKEAHSQFLFKELERNLVEADKRDLPIPKSFLWTIINLNKEVLKECPL